MQSGHGIAFLDQIVTDSASFRVHFDALLEAFSGGVSPRGQIFNLLIATSQLYLDCLLFLQQMAEFNQIAADVEAPEHESNVTREMELRRRFRGLLERSESWSYLQLKHPLADDNLQTREHYVNSFSLHLPEIYEETFQVEQWARAFRGSRGRDSLIDLEIGLKHLAFNHALFVIPALQWQSAD